MCSQDPKNTVLRPIKAVFRPMVPVSAMVICVLTGSLGGCGETDSGKKPDSASTSSPDAPAQTLEKVVAIDPDGRPWKKGPEISSQWPDDPRVDIALKLMESRNFSDAQIVLETILTQQPTIGRARFLLGIVFQKQKQYEAALTHLNTALELDQAFPESRHAGHFKGWCFFNLGRLEEARTSFTQHLTEFPDEGDSYFGLGIVAIDQGDFATAKSSLLKAIDLQKDIPRRAREVAKAHARLGDVYLAEDSLDEARNNYHTAVIRWPDHYEAWAKLARALDRLEEPLKAERARKESDNARQRMGRTVDDSNGGSRMP